MLILGKLGEGSTGILCIVLADFLKSEMCGEEGQRRASGSGEETVLRSPDRVRENLI